MSDAPEFQTIPDWVQKGILAIIAALTSVIAYFYRQLESNNRTTIDELKKEVATNKARIEIIETERLSMYEHKGEMQNKIINLQEEVAILKEKQQKIH